MAKEKEYVQREVGERSESFSYRHTHTHIHETARKQTNKKWYQRTATSLTCTFNFYADSEHFYSFPFCLVYFFFYRFLRFPRARAYTFFSSSRLAFPCFWFAVKCQMGKNECVSVYVPLFFFFSSFLLSRCFSCPAERQVKVHSSLCRDTDSWQHSLWLIFGFELFLFHYCVHPSSSHTTFRLHLTTKLSHFHIK